ncbi:NAD(P)/FAD-dependent oxidoreductase [Mesorhizobium sp. M1163]|uniref:flavin monoamine oxidase family protein n=1 Tax=Mesorhizobium sp. M1163 TaxID=2957065 RepID=UPI00333C0DFF
MTPKNCDVLVVGAGFAGAVAARELSNSGLNVVVLEGRDRVGGRVWSRQAWGRTFEVGGQLVHWSQPHIWAELTRYGFEIYDLHDESHDFATSLYLNGDQLEEMSPEEMGERIGKGFKRIVPVADNVFERPYEPFFRESELELVDHLTMAEGLTQLGMLKDERDILDAALTGAFSAPTENGAYSQCLRRLATGRGYSTGDIIRFRVRGGFQAVVGAILADASAEVLLQTAVVRVEQIDGGVRVHTSDGATWSAKSAVVTVPVNALAGIDFVPSLSEGKRAMMDERQATQGIMFFVHLLGEYKPFMALASSEHPLTWMETRAKIDGGMIAQVLGPDAERLDMADLGQVQTAVRQWLPDAIVAGTLGHNWTADPFSRQTWAIARPGQLVKYHRELVRPEGGVYLAGADYASGWYGYVEGAIESGLAVAHKIRRALGGAQTPDVRHDTAAVS